MRFSGSGRITNAPLQPINGEPILHMHVCCQLTHGHNSHTRELTNASVFAQVAAVKQTLMASVRAMWLSSMPTPQSAVSIRRYDQFTCGRSRSTVVSFLIHVQANMSRYHGAAAVIVSSLIPGANPPTSRIYG